MSAKIVVVYNQKGGCGKSMTSMQLGGGLGLQGFKVLIVDMDKQGTSLIWSTKAPPDEPFPAEVISLAPAHENIIGTIEQKYPLYDFIIIDCPPAIDSSIPWAALNIADLGLVPVSPVLDNVWAAREAKELFLRAREHKPHLIGAYLLSIVTRGKVFDHCKSLLSNDNDIPLLPCQLSRRNAFPESQVFGTTVVQLDPKSAAATEVQTLIEVVLKLLDVKPKKQKSARKGG